MKKVFTLCTLLILNSYSCSKETNTTERCVINGCPYTECEYKEWNSRHFAIMGCKECDSLGYTDVGIVLESIDGRFDSAFYDAKKDFVDSIYENARLDLRTSGFAMLVQVMRNYCTGNIDTSYRLVGTNFPEAYDMAKRKKVSWFYKVVLKDSTAESPTWFEIERVYKNTGW